MHFLIYDFEVFKNDWLVVFKQIGKEHKVYVNDYEGIKIFFNEHKNDVFVGYNNRHYDDFVLKAILSDLNPYKINEWIIEKGKNGWQFPGLNKIYFTSLDLMQDIEGAIGISLKEIESNLGLSIEESEVDFNINRKLTSDEITETIKYCKHDVDCTEHLMNVRSDYLKSRLQLINTFNLPISCLSKTDAQLTAEVMNPRKKSYDDYDSYEVVSSLNFITDKYTKVLDLYKYPIDKSNSMKIDICNVEHRVGFGGLHGATEKMHYDEKNGEILNADVSSYYPSLIIKYDYMCRGVTDRNKYKQIYDQRIAWKKAKDPRQKSFKLVLNKTFGAMGSEYNRLYDLKQNISICVTGQLLLIDLLEKLEPYIVLIQSNTDGICFQTKNRNKCEEIINEWQQRTGMNMEIDNIKQIYQKDVNNYIIEMKDGHIKTKGSYVKNYGGGTYSTNSMTILDDAIVNYLIKNIPIEDTILNCNDVIKFQITAKKGPTFKRVEWQVKNEMIITNNVNRIFASTNKNYGQVFKIKQNGNKNLIGGLPEHCLIFNKDLKELDINLIDKQWYIDQAKDRIKDFIGE